MSNIAKNLILVLITFRGEKSWKLCSFHHFMNSTNRSIATLQ